MGIEQTAPAFGSFTVKPRIGSLTKASIRVPTLRGPIAVDANKTHTVVGVPCGSTARLCLAHHMDVTDTAGIGRLTLLLDGMGVSGERLTLDVAGRHLCAEAVGCGAGDSQRVLTLAWS